MNLALTPELEQLIQNKINTGMYTNASEVVRDALRHMDDHDPYKELREILVPRIAEAKSKNFSSKSVSEIISEVKDNTNNHT